MFALIDDIEVPVESKLDESACQEIISKLREVLVADNIRLETAICADQNAPTIELAMKRWLSTMFFMPQADLRLVRDLIVNRFACYLWSLQSSPWVH